MPVVFGIVNDTGTYGIVTNFERENTAEIATYMGADGDVEGYQEYNEQETMSLTFTQDGTALPTAGQTMTIDSLKYVVETVKETETPDDFATAEITGRRWIANTIPA